MQGWSTTKAHVLKRLMEKISGEEEVFSYGVHGLGQSVR